METDRSIYLSIAELQRRYRAPQPGGADRLTEFELRCFSQHGEDGVIGEIMRRIGIAGGGFVEFGIQSGREGNCVFLADVLGWAGLFIEANEDDFRALQNKYAASDRVATRNAIVTPDNVEALFGQAGVPAEPDVLSIDVDGQDYWIWDALGSYRPRLVVIEYNAVLPPGRQLVQPRGHSTAWDGNDYFGASLDALCALAERKGYRLVHTELAAINAFFVRSDLVADAFPAPADVPRRHEPNYFLQGFHHPADPGQRPYTDLESGGASQRAGDPREGSGDTPLTRELAEALVARTDFIWHQRFELVPGVFTPGISDMHGLLDEAGIPPRLDGATVLDIGTTNGGAAFLCERRGASRVVAVDIADDRWFGFATLKQALGSRVEHVQANIYELPEVVREQFDFVLFWGVLYHLRHPLLALDNVRRLARGSVAVETAVSDRELAELREVPLARFYRTDELGGDGSNWFAPNVAALLDWCRSCGLEPTRVRSWPDPPGRAMVLTQVSEPEYPKISHERPLSSTLLGKRPRFSP